MQHDDLVYVGDMYDFAVGVARRADGLDRDVFDDDEDLRLAIVQLLGWLGVAARRVSPEFKEAHPEIPWAFAIGMRNILAHAYLHVDWDVVFKTATENIPGLAASLADLLPPDQR
jgi:uncharacterized protein with HEPN domain